MERRFQNVNWTKAPTVPLVSQKGITRITQMIMKLEVKITTAEYSPVFWLSAILSWTLKRFTIDKTLKYKKYNLEIVNEFIFFLLFFYIVFKFLQ
jgi:hypothetical protein